MSTLGPLQKLSLTLLASGALMRICTRPAASIRGYSAPQTFVSADRNWPDSCARQVPAISMRAQAKIFMITPVRWNRGIENRGRRAGGTDTAASRVAQRPPINLQDAQYF